MLEALSKERSKSLFFTISVLTLLALGGCEEVSKGPIKVGTILWPGHEPLHLAQEHAFFDDQDVELIELSSSTEVIRAMKNSSLHAATLTLDESISLLVSGVDIVVVVALDVSQGADMVIAQEPFASLNDLKGKRIAVDTGAVGAIMLVGFLEFAGVSANDVEIVPLKIRNHFSVFHQMDVDVVVTYQPVAGELLRAGGHKIFDSSNIPNQIMDALVVRRDAIEGYSDQLQILVNGYFSARELMESDRQAALTRMAKRSGISKVHLSNAFEGLHLPSLEENRIWLGRCDQFLGRRVRDLSELMKKHDLIESLPRDNLVCDATWVQNTTVERIGLPSNMKHGTRLQGVPE